MVGHNPKSAKIKENQRQLFTNQRKSIPTELTPPGWAQSQINANQRKSMPIIPKSTHINPNQVESWVGTISNRAPPATSRHVLSHVMTLPPRIDVVRQTTHEQQQC